MSVRPPYGSPRGKPGPSGYAFGYVVLLGGTLAGLALAEMGGLRQSGRLTGAMAVPAPPTRETALAESIGPEDVQVMLDRYCVRCHSERRRVADLVLETVDPTHPSANPETWEKVVDKLRLRSMPPPPNTRPEPETYAAVSAWLESELDRAWLRDPNPGRVASVHRLNRTEYNNAINDLLNLDVDVRDQLPGDETTDGGFDNVASALTISTVHLERYMSVARQLTRVAVGLPPASPGVEIFRVDDLRDQTVRMSEDLPLGSRGGIAVRHNFPVGGDYVISVKLTTNYAEYFRGMGWPQELDVRLDGKLLERFTVGGGALDYRPAADHYGGAGSGPGWPGSPEWEEYMQFGAQEHLNVRVRVEAGPHVIGVSFPRAIPEDEYILPQQPLRLWGLAEKNSHDYMGYAGVSEVHLDGPYDIERATVTDTPSRQSIFVCEPSVASEEEECAAEILGRMARRAFRRPVTDQEVAHLLEFYRLGREDGGTFDSGIQIGLERILVDPDFLLRIYRDPPVGALPASANSAISQAAASKSSDVYPLSDLEVASRLSFFLWSSVPDERLLDLAEEGRLTEPDVLRSEVERMLADPRAHKALVEGFASQWLMLRVVDEMTADERIYPDFDHGMRQAMRKETELFFESTLRENRSVLDLLRADYTYVNDRLARHYGIPNVLGSHFRRVELPDLEQRGGILGQASVLAVSSYPDRTSPVLRGKWLVENILGSHVPPPPPDLDTSLKPSEDETAEGREPTMRELLRRHREDTACSSCHSVMDPLGFALESFDALGGWREIDEKGNAVDDLGRWPSGEEVRSFSGLRSMLLREDEQFVRTVTGKLMSYALGRTLDYYDQPAIRTIVRDAASEDYSWSAVIRGLVLSPQFLMRTRAPTAAESR